MCPRNRYQASVDGCLKPAEALPLGMSLGAGVFTAFRHTPGQPVFQLPAHYARLKRDATAFGWVCPWDSADAFSHAVDAYRQAIPEPKVMRVSLTPTDIMSSDTAITVETRDIPALPETYRLQSVPLDRPWAQHKHISYLGEWQALAQARAAGFDDILRVSNGQLAEAAFANLFLWMPDDRLLTPPVSHPGCLPGIVRQSLLDSADDMGMIIQEQRLTLEDIQKAQGVVLSNAVHGLWPVAGIDTTRFDLNAVQPLMMRFRQCHPLQNKF